MTKIFFSLALLSAGVPVFAAADCSGQTEACSAVAKEQSPFVEASLRESVPPHLEAKAKKAGTPAVSASTAVPAGLPAEAGGELSSPAWLLLVLAGLTALYFYLRGAARKRKKK